MPDLEQALSPVRPSEDRPADKPLLPGVALCLSGGGYRAMLFHLGALKRLNELAYLPKLDRISSVSGGSIAAAALGVAWPRLGFDAAGVASGFDREVLVPVRTLAGQTVDTRSIIAGILGPRSIGEHVTSAYRKHLFGDKTLQDLPDRPRLVINATNMQSGVLWRFSKPYMRDYKVGEIKNPTVPLAVAVAASAAFPPVLSPIRLRPRMEDYSPAENEPLHSDPYMTNVILSDGGVYDNLGLETAWKRHQTILISDGSGQLANEEHVGADWIRQGRRAIDIIGSQVASQRKRQAIESFRSGIRTGTYWGTYTNIEDYGLSDALPCPHAQTLKLAGLPTRLRGMDDVTQERLINWGYAVCDAAMRRWVAPGARRPADFPYPSAGS